MLRDLYPDMWLTSGRPVAMMIVFDEFADRRDPVANRKGILQLMAGQPDAAGEAGTVPPWVLADLTDLMLRPVPEEAFSGHPWDGCGVNPSATNLFCQASLAQTLLRSGESASLDSLLLVQLPRLKEEMARVGAERYAWHVDHLVDAVRAYRLAGTDPTAAIEALEALQGTGSIADVAVRRWLMELYDAQGNTDETIRYMESLRYTVFDSYANYRLGGLYEQAGDPVAARAAYIRFLQAWEEAEPDLPQDDEARDALENLLRG